MKVIYRDHCQIDFKEKKAFKMHEILTWLHESQHGYPLHWGFLAFAKEKKDLLWS